MNATRIITLGIVLAGIGGLLGWLARTPEVNSGPVAATGPDTAPAVVTFRLGLAPERDLFQQRRAYLGLAEYLNTHVRLPRGISTVDAPPILHVELVTASTYAGVLQDFKEHQIDGSFVGSLVAVLAVDRAGAQVWLKSQSVSGVDTYAGVIFVAPDSKIRTLEDLARKKLGGVRTTTAGAIFPVYALCAAKIPAENMPPLIWSGTHDDVINEVLAGHLDVGAAKDTRIDAYEGGHPEVRLRRLATSGRVPDNALVMSRSVRPDVQEAMAQTLLAMRTDPQAAPVLTGLGLRGFETCSISEYAPLYDMIEAIAPQWSKAGVEGPAPRRPMDVKARREGGVGGGP